MIIAVDAGMLGITDERLKVGVWRVAVNFLTQLGKIDKRNTYRLYSFAPIPASLMKQFGPRMENRVLAPGTGWMSVRLPLEFVLRTPDVFLGLAQALPRWHGRSLGFVYDLGFLAYPEAYPDSHTKLATQTEKMVRRADHIIAISEATKKDIGKQYGTDPKSITVAHPGVSSLFSLRGPRHLTKTPYFFIAASLKPGKNIPLAIRVLAKFNKQTDTPHTLIIAGSTYWLDPMIGKTIEELEMGKYVDLVGFVPDKKLSALYRGAAAVLIPSLIEGFCLPAVEAMACGTPVIASPAGALPEIIGTAGIIADANEQSFLTAMKKITSDASYRASLVRAAGIQARKFRWDRFARTVLRQYSV